MPPVETWYEIKIYWGSNNVQALIARNPEHLKELLDREAFCLRHGCPLPETVTIMRMAGPFLAEHGPNL